MTLIPRTRMSLRQLAPRLARTFGGRKHFLMMLVVTVIGVLLRLYVASFLAIDRDEGQFLYYGQRALEGAIPVRDLVPEPDPLYIWMVAFMELLLGPRLFTIRLLSTIFSAIGILALFFVSKYVTNERYAILAALIYAVSPSAILYNAIGNYRQVAWPMIIVSLYFFAVGLKEDKWKQLFVFGAVVGLATVTYRITAVFLVTGPILVTALRRHDLRSAVKSVSSMVGGGLITSLGVLAPIVYFSSFNWVNRIWGFGGGFGSYSGFGINQLGSAAFSSDRIDTLVRIAFVDSREWYYLALGAIIGTAFLITSGRERKSSATYVLLATLILASIIIAFGPFLPSNPDFGTYVVWPPYNYATVVCLCLGAIGVVGLLAERLPSSSFTYGRNIFFFWILSLLVAFSFFQYGHVFYFVAFAAPLSFLTAIGLNEFRKRLSISSARILSRQQLLPIFLISVMITSGVVATVSMYTTQIQERDVTQAQAIAIGDYINSHTNPNDQILTGNLIYAVYSDRDNELHMYQAYLYYQPDNNPLPGDPYGTTPTISELVGNLTTGRVVYVIMDTLLMQVMLDHPVLRDTVDAHFSLETTLFGVQLWRFMS